jgi:Acetyltransferase (GNAT) family
MKCPTYLFCETDDLAIEFFVALFSQNIHFVPVDVVALTFGGKGGIVAAEMTDPMNSLLSFQQALADGEIAPQKCELHADLLLLVDNAQGSTRFTYALVKSGRVVAIAIFVPADPIEGNPCFNTGYAVDQASRSRGYGGEVTQKAFDELFNGFRRAGIPHLYAEAIVSTENEHSNKLASKLFSANPDACTDGVSGQPAFHYVRQLF